MRFLFIADPMEHLDPEGDSTIALMEAAHEAGHELWVTRTDLLNLVDGAAVASMRNVTVVHPARLVDGKWRGSRDWLADGPDGAVRLPLDAMDVIFVRTEPPFDATYLHATQMLDHVDQHETLIVNAPAGLRAANEKLYALRFPDLIPPTTVTYDPADVLDFVQRTGCSVLKPLDGKGGEQIFFLDPADRNLSTIVQASLELTTGPVLVQAYLPQASTCDKRIILLDGVPVGAVERNPCPTDWRANTCKGATMSVAVITERDQMICDRIAPDLRRDGLHFVGIDVIGDYLTEVNVTSPGGLRGIDRLHGGNTARRIVDWATTARTGWQSPEPAGSSDLHGAMTS